MTYCFRTRFNLGNHAQLHSTEQQIVLTNVGDAPEVVVLRPPGDVSILEARVLLLKGSGYSTVESATEAAARWKAWVQSALARCNIGADFGDRAPKSVITDVGLTAMTAVAETPVLNDVHGTIVFPCEPAPVFAGMGPVQVLVGKAGERFAQAVDAARRFDVRLNDREQLAYDLYSGSFFQTVADSRFLMLMMAIETLIDCQERPSHLVELVDSFVTTARQAGLAADEANSLVGALRNLRNESISQAGKRLASALGEREYMGEKPPTFFSKCYAIRSRLVHGAYPRPAREEVDVRAATLENFVADLLSGRLLDEIPD